MSRTLTGDFSPSWLAALRFTSVDKHPVNDRAPGYAAAHRNALRARVVLSERGVSVSGRASRGAPTD